MAVALSYQVAMAIQGSDESALLEE